MAFHWYVLLASADFLVKVQEKVEKEEQDIKDHLNSLYSKYGKLKDMGKGAKEILTRKDHSANNAQEKNHPKHSTST